MTNLFNLEYDHDDDVLYVTKKTNEPAYAQEEEPGVFWRYSATDNSLVGMTVVDFKSYWQPRVESLMQQFSDHFHVSTGEALEMFDGLRNQKHL